MSGAAGRGEAGQEVAAAVAVAVAAFAFRTLMVGRRGGRRTGLVAKGLEYSARGHFTRRTITRAAALSVACFRQDSLASHLARL